MFLSAIFALLLDVAYAKPQTTTRDHGNPHSSTITIPSVHTIITPPRRPTAYSDFLFYDVFTRVSNGMVGSTATSHHGHPTNRPIRPHNKIEDVIKQATVCTHSAENYHVIISPTGIAPSIASAVCNSFGWQYAITRNADWQLIDWVLGNCTWWPTGIYAFEGHFTGGCQFVEEEGVTLLKLGDDECAAAGDFPILCMDTPVTSTTTTTTSFVEHTVFVKNSPNKVIDLSRVAKKREKQQGEIINGYDTCTSSVNGYHMVYDIFESGDAAQVCSDLGWYLADIPYSSVSDILSLFDFCQPWDILFHINSYDDLRAGACRFAYILPWPSVWMIIANDPAQCSYYDLPVLCQEDPTSVTISTGTQVLTTTTQTVTLQEVVTTNTVTVTL